MKKIFCFLFFAVIFTIGYSTSLFAESAENEILVKTIDNSEAIKIFKEQVSDNPNSYDFLIRMGFESGSSIGTPFSMEYQEGGADKENIYIFYYPIINNGKIVNYISNYITETGPSWESSKWLNKNLTQFQLSNGNPYSIIIDKNFNAVAVSDNDVVMIQPDSKDSPIDYDVPYEDKETKVVNIMESVIDTSSITSFINSQMDNERIILENAEKNNSTIIQKNAVKFGAVNKNNKLLVPLRNITELIGCTIVKWDSSERAAYVKKGDNTVKFVIGKTQYNINDKIYTLDIPAEIYNGKTFIPLSALSEAFDTDTVFNSVTKTITLAIKK